MHVRMCGLSECVGPLSNRSASSHSAATFSPQAIRHAKLKLKPPFLPFSSEITVSGFYLSFLLYLSHSLSLPPHPFCLPFFPSGTRERFALITELLFTPAEEGRDTLQTPTPAHCHAPSILVLPFMPVLPGMRVFVCLHLLVFNFVKTKK